MEIQASVKIRTANVNGMSKQDAKYLALIEDCLQRSRELRKEMRRSKAEIERLKAASHRKLAAIDTLLGRV